MAPSIPLDDALIMERSLEFASSETDISNKSSVFDFDVIRISPIPKPLSTVITSLNSGFLLIRSTKPSLMLSKATSEVGMLSSFISNVTDAGVSCAAPFIDTVIIFFVVSSLDRLIKNS